MELAKKKNKIGTRCSSLKRMNTAYRYIERLMRNQIVKLFFFNDKEVVLVV